MSRISCRGKGLTIGETYAPMVKFESPRAVTAIAAACKKHIHGMDVETTFLNGELEEEVYMQMIRGGCWASTDGMEAQEDLIWA